MTSLTCEAWTLAVCYLCCLAAAHALPLLDSHDKLVEAARITHEMPRFSEGASRTALRTQGAAAAGTTNDTACFPLLPPGTLFGVSYGAPSNQTLKKITDAAYGKVVAKQARLFQLGLTWTAIEPKPNQIDFELVAGFFQDVHLGGLVPLVNIAVINTNQVSVPSDLADPANPAKLAPGLHWNDTAVLQRYQNVVTVLAPLAVYYGAFYWGLGNEVDANLGSQADANAWEFLAFVQQMRAYIQTITTTQLAVGVTCTVEGLASMSTSPPSWWQSLTDITDSIPLTHYPLLPNADVMPLDDIDQVWSQALTLLPNDHCLIVQEYGCPAGYGNASSTDKSSQQLQAGYFTLLSQLFQKLNTTQFTPTGRVRAASAFLLLDFSTSDCLQYSRYYNATNPAFVEYLCTLGMFTRSGDQKLSFDAFLESI